MILYHFCAKRHADSIARTGIRPGALPVSRGGIVVIERGWTWLTSSPSFMQPWDTRTNIPYSRTDVRFTVEILDGKAHPWTELRGSIGADDDWLDFFEAIGGAEEWWIYRGGHIPPEWLLSRKDRAAP